MNEQHQITLRSRNSTATAPLDSDQQTILRRFAQPTSKPKTTYNCSPWEKHQPIEQSLDTRLWTTSPPSEIKRLRPPSRSPSPADWETLDHFQHWVPPPLPIPTTAHVYGEQMVPTKRSVDGRATAGAWNSTRVTREVEQEKNQKKEKEKKRVRVESPATTLSRTAATQHKQKSSPGAELRRSPRKVVTSIVAKDSPRKSTRTRSQNTKELVPATPEDTMAREAPDLAVGAIERCIPPPYHHVVSHDLGPTNYPSRQKLSRVLHSFVDPSYSPSHSTSSASLLGAGNRDLSVLSPKTHQFLIPGRRGSWLIPISAPFPTPQAASPIWFNRPPPAPPATSKPSTRPLQKDTTPSPIQWTSPRLTALWSFLSDLNKSSSFGPLRAACHASSSADPRLPDYIKITLDANLALAFRTLLSLVSVEIVLGSTSRPGKRSRSTTREKLKEKETNVDTRQAGAGGGPEEEAEADPEKWLSGKALIWTDESGRAILVA
ncbi:hypothetical protein JCM5350_001521 [Sporobolomyces pararoseus]